MDTFNKLYELSDKIRLLKSSVNSEEATKISFVLPFFSALGYDVFNHQEVYPEYKSTFKTDGTTKVDLAILKNSIPEILIEIKDCNFTLNEQFVGQLAGYFAPSEAKFGILTNGIVYRFYSDVKKQNIMDKEHFLEIDLLSIDKRSLSELEMFVKANFNAETAKKRAEFLLYERLAYLRVSKEFEEPSDGFVDFIFGKSDPELKLSLTSAINKYVKDVTSENSVVLESVSDVDETADKSLNEDGSALFSAVKAIIEDTGSIHRFKVNIQQHKNYNTVYYRNTAVCYFPNHDKNFKTIRFGGTTIQTRKNFTDFSLTCEFGISEFKPQILKRIEFIDWWYLNPKADKGGIQ